MRIWIRLWKDSRMLQDHMATDNTDDTRTHKVFRMLDEACRQFDLGRPICLDKNINEFKRQARTRFYQDSFIDEIPFDYMEFQVLEED